MHSSMSICGLEVHSIPCRHEFQIKFNKYFGIGRDDVGTDLDHKSGVHRKRDVDSVETIEEDVGDYGEGLDRMEPESEDNSRRPTNVIIRENYLDCVNINTEVDKLWTNFNVISNESCLTLYRFAPFEITYDVHFKNGSISQTKIQLGLQDSERTTDTIVVTLTGKVVEGYLTGAHFQSVTVYPVLNDNICLTEPGITELRSNSASVTFILLPNSPVTESTESSITSRVLRLPEAFDCFGNASIDYIPGLVDFKQLWTDSDK
ncbi:unnamed protein product [Oppiella nova]|uniref:Uncharacterized protein n=1 Tax=Oppiella nova TaxID=334625 RepID=A0A7R9M8D4_9ACAR|nr:unnamed protein product [Oppiella nova]CAG2172709.1 unnamed protein product [Oppiella nova]